VTSIDGAGYVVSLLDDVNGGCREIARAETIVFEISMAYRACRHQLINKLRSRVARFKPYRSRLRRGKHNPFKPRARWPECSGRIIRLPDVDSVGMQRPVVKRLRLAEPCLCQLRGLTFIRSVDFQGTLANFAFVAVCAEHVLHEPNDKS
jgi:hypothetical protein